MVLCTYFDRAFLPRGLALHASLQRHWPSATLLALCLDDTTGHVLRTLNLPGVRLLTLAELEAFDPALASVRGGRSDVGFYLTCTPALLRYALQQTPLAIYVDADLYFFSAPDPVFAELGDGSIYVHEHRPKRSGWDADGGRFNVGLVAIRGDEQGRACVARWREKCLEWCEHERSDGRFGDQAYLNEWPALFDRLVIARHPGVGAGPWNISDSRYSVAPGGSVLVDGAPLVFFHFTRLQQVAPGLARTHVRAYGPGLDPVVRRAVYRPYLRELQAQAHRVRGCGVLLESALGRVQGATDDTRFGGGPGRTMWQRASTLFRSLTSGEFMLMMGGRAL